MEQATYDGKCYFITFIDDFTHFMMVFSLERKSEASKFLKIYVEQVSAHFNSRVSVIRCDCRGEYMCTDLRVQGKGYQVAIHYWLYVTA